MELETITIYINSKLKSELKFSEKYYLDSDKENNTITIKTLFPLLENNLFIQVINDQIKGISFFDNILCLVKSIDSDIIDIKLSINVFIDKYNGFTIVKIRDDTLINILEVFPDEILNYIVSFIDIKSIKNFATTSHKYYDLINNDNFWLTKCSTCFSLDVTYIRKRVNDNSFTEYKELYKSFSKINIDINFNNHEEICKYVGDIINCKSKYLDIYINLDLLQNHRLIQLIKTITLKNIITMFSVHMTDMLLLIINKSKKNKIITQYEKDSIILFFKSVKREDLINLLN